MEGCISIHFYFIQHYHLALSGSYLNGSDWTKSLISKLLHITHSQWIYRNFTLHDKLCGYLHNKSLEDIKQTIEELAETPPEDIPEGSKFLLEINFGDLTKSHIENQQYWIIALQAAITAGHRSIASGSRARRIRHRVNRKLPSRSKHISTTNLLKTSNSPLRSWRKCSRKIFLREASFYSRFCRSH